jgi:eukaryotic-like serine/threonine-protein kinase
MTFLMKSLFRFALLALMLLVVALVSALTTMRLAIHVREVSVPDLVGKTPAEARRIAEQNGLQLDVERQYYSANVPAGNVLSQLPPSGTQVRRGWQIRVAESLGPQRVAIPNVVGQSERAAEINIQRRGLNVAAVARLTLPDTEAGNVVSQAPPSNASSVSAPKISLLVSEPSWPQAFVMPNFVGQPLGSVTLALQDAGFRLGTVTAQSGTAAGSTARSPASIIVSQNPRAGEKVTAGSAVDFEVK